MKEKFQPRCCVAVLQHQFVSDALSESLSGKLGWLMINGESRLLPPEEYTYPSSSLK